MGSPTIDAKEHNPLSKFCLFHNFRFKNPRLKMSSAPGNIVNYDASKKHPLKHQWGKKKKNNKQQNFLILQLFSPQTTKNQ